MTIATNFFDEASQIQILHNELHEIKEDCRLKLLGGLEKTLAIGELLTNIKKKHHDDSEATFKALHGIKAVMNKPP